MNEILRNSSRHMPSALQHKAIKTSIHRLIPHLPCSGGVQAVSVLASEAQVGGAYVAVVTEAAPALPEVADVEEETELADEAPIAPPGSCLVFKPTHGSLAYFTASPATSNKHHIKAQ